MKYIQVYFYQRMKVFNFRYDVKNHRICRSIEIKVFEADQPDDTLIREADWH